MTFNRGNLGFLCLAWAFFFLLGGAIALNVPFVLLLIATVLYLVG
jgi:hypothetical protein